MVASEKYKQILRDAAAIIPKGLACDFVSRLRR